MRDLLARRCRWWRVIGRNSAGVFEIGSFLAPSRGAALRRARRERSLLVQGLKLEAH
jgi:hypothetical protein